MEYLIGIGVILGGMFVYGYMQASKWETGINYCWCNDGKFTRKLK